MKKVLNAIKQFFILILQSIALGILYIFTKIKYRIKINNNNIELPREPAIYLSNHQTNWDAIFYRIFLPKRIFFLAHDELFKNKFTAWFFTNICDTVKRGSSKNDISAVKQLIQLKKEKKNIGIFPEGGIPFWGETNPIEKNIAKLCKKLGMPIVIHQIYGGSFVNPRYSTNKAKIRPVIERKRIITTEELETLSVDELLAIINENLYVNDFEIQKTRQLEINRPKPAEQLERGLFCCPHCHSFNTLKSENETIKCTNCNFYNVVNKFELLESKQPEYTYFNNYIEWNNFQLKYLNEYLSNYNKEEAIITTYYSDIQYGIETESYSHIEKLEGSLEVFKDKLIITIGLDIYEIPYSDVLYAYVEFRETLEIKMSANKVRIESKDSIWSPYQFAKTINILKSLNLRKPVIQKE